MNKTIIFVCVLIISLGVAALVWSGQETQSKPTIRNTVSVVGHLPPNNNIAQLLADNPTSGAAIEGKWVGHIVEFKNELPFKRSLSFDIKREDGKLMVTGLEGFFKGTEQDNTAEIDWADPLLSMQLCALKVSQDGTLLPCDWQLVKTRDALIGLYRWHVQEIDNELYTIDYDAKFQRQP